MQRGATAVALGGLKAHVAGLAAGVAQAQVQLAGGGR